VFCHSGIDCPWHKNPQSRLREKDLSEFFPETGRTAAVGTGRHDQKYSHGAGIGGGGIVCGMSGGNSKSETRNSKQFEMTEIQMSKTVMASGHLRTSAFFLGETSVLGSSGGDNPKCCQRVAGGRVGETPGTGIMRKSTLKGWQKLGRHSRCDPLAPFQGAEILLQRTGGIGTLRGLNPRLLSGTASPCGADAFKEPSI